MPNSIFLCVFLIIYSIGFPTSFAQAQDRSNTNGLAQIQQLRDSFVQMQAAAIALTFPHSPADSDAKKFQMTLAMQSIGQLYESLAKYHGNAQLEPIAIKWISDYKVEIKNIWLLFHNLSGAIAFGAFRNPKAQAIKNSLAELEFILNSIVLHQLKSNAVAPANADRDSEIKRLENLIATMYAKYGKLSHNNSMNRCFNLFHSFVKWI